MLSIVIAVITCEYEDVMDNLEQFDDYEITSEAVRPGNSQAWSSPNIPNVFEIFTVNLGELVTFKEFILQGMTNVQAVLVMILNDNGDKSDEVSTNII